MRKQKIQKFSPIKKEEISIEIEIDEDNYMMR